jgi:hypothetical protein
MRERHIRVTGEQSPPDAIGMATEYDAYAEDALRTEIHRLEKVSRAIADYPNELELATERLLGEKVRELQRTEMSEQPMTPLEMRDGLDLQIKGQPSPAFERMCRQLRVGILVMETPSTGFGYAIRAATPEELKSALRPSSDQPVWDAVQRGETQPVWERCTSCGIDYRYPHLCRESGLCGICHPEGVCNPE